MAINSTRQYKCYIGHNNVTLTNYCLYTSNPTIMGEEGPYGNFFTVMDRIYYAIGSIGINMISNKVTPFNTDHYFSNKTLTTTTSNGRTQTTAYKFFSINTKSSLDNYYTTYGTCGLYNPQYKNNYYNGSLYEYVIFTLQSTSSYKSYKFSINASKTSFCRYGSIYINTQSNNIFEHNLYNILTKNSISSLSQMNIQSGNLKRSKSSTKTLTIDDLYAFVSSISCDMYHNFGSKRANDYQKYESWFTLDYDVNVALFQYSTSNNTCSASYSNNINL